MSISLQENVSSLLSDHSRTVSARWSISGCDNVVPDQG